MSAPVLRHGLVTALLPDGTAQIVPTDAAGCSGNCAACHGCSSDAEKCFSAVNAVGAKPGDRVTAEGRPEHRTSSILLRLAVPAAAFALGCILAAAFFEREGMVAGAGILCMLLGCVFSAGMKRRQDEKICFEILSIDG